jgi:sensor domain CHASE-containing protein
MEHLYTYAIFAGLALSQWGCHKLAERHAKKVKEEVQTAVHGVHGGIFFALAAHPVTIETVHEWLVHALIYSH